MNLDIIRTVLSIVFNIAIVTMTVLAMSEFYSEIGGRANMQVKKARCLEYFTVQSNLLCSLTAIVMIVFGVLRLINGMGAPLWALVLKLIGTAAVGLTFFVVFLMLAPYAGYKFMIEGGSLYMHLITPLAAMVSFILLDGGPKLPMWTVALAIIPTFLYGIVYLYQVVVKGEKNGGWEDFYGFNKGGKWPLSSVLLLAMTALIAFLLILGHNALA